MRCTAAVRPGFTPLSIALMVVGFLIAWPLGLAVLAYMAWSDRLVVWPRFKAFMRGVGQGLKEDSCNCSPASILPMIPTRCSSPESASNAERAAGSSNTPRG